MTMGTTMGLYFLIMKAVPLRMGRKGFVVPCGKVITQPSSSAFPMLEISLNFTCRLTSLPDSRHVLSIETDPA